MHIEPPAAWRQADLLIVGHGASQPPAAGFAVYAHARAIAERKIFASVQAGLLNGAPGLEEAFAACRSECIFAVPFFMSEGHAVREEIPRRLGPDPRLRFTEPVGTHPRVAEIIAAGAAELCRAEGADPAAAELILAGHGSTRDPASGAAARACACLIQGFAAARAAFLEEPPLLVDMVAGLTASATVVAGYFADMGPHAAEDVPRVIGLEPGSRATTRPNGAHVLYAGAVGPAPAMAEIILARIAEVDVAEA